MSNTATTIEIGVLVFHRGLAMILVVAVISASTAGSAEEYQRPVTAGVGITFAATLST
jgi:high-affinity iron transporter